MKATLPFFGKDMYHPERFVYTLKKDVRFLKGLPHPGTYAFYNSMSLINLIALGNCLHQ